MKKQYKVGDVVRLSKPDHLDYDWGLDKDVVGTVVEVGDTFIGVNWQVEEAKGLHNFNGRLSTQTGSWVYTEQLALASKPRTTHPWKLEHETRERANYLVSKDDEPKGIFIKGPHGQDIHVFCGHDGRIAISVWGSKGTLEMAVSDRVKMDKVSRF